MYDQTQGSGAELCFPYSTNNSHRNTLMHEVPLPFLGDKTIRFIFRLGLCKHFCHCFLPNDNRWKLIVQVYRNNPHQQKKLGSYMVIAVPTGNCAQRKCVFWGFWLVVANEPSRTQYRYISIWPSRMRPLAYY